MGQDKGIKFYRNALIDYELYHNGGGLRWTTQLMLESNGSLGERESVYTLLKTGFTQTECLVVEKADDRDVQDYTENIIKVFDSFYNATNKILGKGLHDVSDLAIENGAAFVLNDLQMKLMFEKSGPSLIVPILSSSRRPSGGDN